jgi:hypothetical protein
MSDEDPLLKATDRLTKEQLDRLMADYVEIGPPVGLWNRINDADAVRFCTWPGQRTDGKKHSAQPGVAGKEAFPWEGACDTRPMIVDDIINEMVALCSAAYERALTGGKAANDQEAAYAVALLDYYTNNLLFDRLTDEVELSVQYIQQYGWTVLNPCWVQELTLRRQKVGLPQLDMVAKEIAPMFPQQPGLANLVPLVMDEEQEEVALVVLGLIYDTYSKKQLEGALDIEVKPLKETLLKRALRQLRRGEEANVPVPYLCRNEPAVYALKPWVEVLLPFDTGDIQDGRIVFRREFMSESRLRARIVSDDYDLEWVEEAVKFKGTMSTTPSWFGGTSATLAQGQVGFYDRTSIPKDQIEVLHAFFRAVDDDDVPAVYCTTFHSEVKAGRDGRPLYAKHELIDYPHGEFPFVLGKREHLSRCATASRGVPEVSYTWQNEEKALSDAVIDWTSLGVIPPANVYQDPKQLRYKFHPAAQNLVRFGKEPRFMEIPGGGVPLALEARDQLRYRRAHYYGTHHADLPPEASQTRSARTVQRFLTMWVRAFRQVLSLAQKYLPDAEFARITGAPEGWLEQRRDKFGLLTASLSFDVRELSEELVLKRIEMMNKAVVPADTQGVIQKAKWVEIMVTAVNPKWAKQLLVPVPEASQALFNSVKDDMAQMFLGNPPQMVENDPTAQAKLQFAQQIVAANPLYQEQLQKPGHFQKLVQVYAKNLSFSVTQEKNKQIGRIGVDPQEAAA